MLWSMINSGLVMVELMIRHIVFYLILYQANLVINRHVPILNNADLDFTIC